MQLFYNYSNNYKKHETNPNNIINIDISKVWFRFATVLIFQIYIIA